VRRSKRPSHIASATLPGTMSAQAVLSMIASALPASSSGTSGSDDASGFQGLLSGLLSGDREGAGDRPPTVGDGRWPDVSGRLTLTPTDKAVGSEPLVLPGAEDGK